MSFKYKEIENESSDNHFIDLNAHVDVHSLNHPPIPICEFN